MGYEWKELTDEEWESLMRMEEMLGKSTPERLERCFQEFNACVKENEAFFAMLPTILEI